MPKHASHATLERERTLSRIVADDEPVSPAALEECFGVLPLGDADFEMLDIVGVSDADELDLDVADLVEVGRTAAMQATQELAAAANSAAEAARLEQAALKEKARQEKAAGRRFFELSGSGRPLGLGPRAPPNRKQKQRAAGAKL